MNQEFVVTVCGPHMYDDRDSPCYNRVDAATQAALYRHAVLLIAGDARNGQDLARFVERSRRLLAYDAVVECYDPAGDTLGDVQATLRAIRERIIDGDPAEVMLVTDDYHMRRLGVMFRGEMARTFARGQLRVRDFGIPGPPRAPTDLELAREEQGLCDYLAVTYGQNHDGVHWGKPAPADIIIVPTAPLSIAHADAVASL